MPVAISLSSGPVRQLTSREIALILCSTLSGIMRMDPHEPHDIATLLRTVGCDAHPEYMLVSGASSPTWIAAYMVTANAFYEWCDADSVDEALEWMRQAIKRPSDVALALAAARGSALG